MSEPVPENANTKGKVLIIDDDEKFLNTITRLLTRDGYAVVSANSPQQGLTMAHQQTPGVVLTDTVMPGMNGFQVVQRIRERGRGTQVIVMTGFVEPTKVLEAYIAGATDFISKLAKAEDLIQAVERAMFSYSRWRSLVTLSVKERGKSPPDDFSTDD